MEHVPFPCSSCTPKMNHEVDQRLRAVPFYIVIYIHFTYVNFNEMSCNANCSDHIAADIQSMRYYGLHDGF